MSNIQIRKANKEDVKDIYNLVLELAIFENEPTALKIDVEDYLKAFDESLFNCTVAECDGNIIGIAVYYMTFSTWRGRCMYLEDFYVKPDFRKFGTGQRLFDAYLNEAKMSKATMAKWQVLDWNEIGLNFYEKNNAIIEKNWWNGKIYF
jgi:GNAT superfamily N-acetyltransferase